ncbi:MAG: hypothetical protein Q8P41_32275 [Pseudomonadota bacterium]|nr:hypothetical protein [Pseudomonadota bacterium]
MLLLLSACADPFEEPGASPDLPADARVDPADVGPLAPGEALLEGPDAVLEPGEERMTCGFGTWTGPDVGLHAVRTWQAAGGHHLQLLGTTVPALDVPDGTVADCTGEGGSFSMADLEPLIIAEETTVDGVATALGMGLAPGMAVELEAGQRWVLQSHYINYGDEPMRVRDLAVLATVPTEEVTTWAAPLIFSRQDFSLPPGEASTTSFRCETDQKWQLHSLLGHMHEWGTRFTVERMADGVASPFYEVDEWDPAYRDEPVVQTWAAGEMTLPAGSTFRTTCEWYNDTDAALVFPHEMCVAVAMIYPQKGPVICNGDGLP